MHGVSGFSYLGVSYTVHHLFRYQQPTRITRKVNPCFTLCPLRPLPSVYDPPQSMQASDRKKCDISLDRLEGPWQKPSGEPAFTSDCDGPANLVVIEELQVWIYADRSRQTLFRFMPIPQRPGYVSGWV